MMFFFYQNIPTNIETPGGFLVAYGVHLKKFTQNM